MTDRLQLPTPDELDWLGPEGVDTQRIDQLAAALDDELDAHDGVWVAAAAHHEQRGQPEPVLALGRSEEETLRLVTRFSDEVLTQRESRILSNARVLMGGTHALGGLGPDRHIAVTPYRLQRWHVLRFLRRYARRLYREEVPAGVRAACERFWSRYGGRRPLCFPNTPSLARLSW